MREKSTFYHTNEQKGNEGSWNPSEESSISENHANKAWNECNLNQMTKCLFPFMMTEHPSKQHLKMADFNNDLNIDNVKLSLMYLCGKRQTCTSIYHNTHTSHRCEEMGLSCDQGDVSWDREELVKCGQQGYGSPCQNPARKALETRWTTNGHQRVAHHLRLVWGAGVKIWLLVMWVCPRLWVSLGGRIFTGRILTLSSFPV